MRLRTAVPAATQRRPKLVDQLRETLRSRHYSRRTGQIYCLSVNCSIDFHDLRHAARWRNAGSTPFGKSDGCTHKVLTWNNGKPAPAPFGLHYEGPQFKGGQMCRQWWTGVVANVSVGLQLHR